MDLNTLWFGLVFVLFTGYLVLEGFDFGVGLLLPFLGKDERERRVMINTIGPHWDGNEVWVIAAGGAIFAAFPHWYATLFSGFYLALILMLMALIARGVAFEFRSKDKRAAWRALWDGCIFAGSLVPALLWGVTFANLIRGVPVDSGVQYAGGFWNLLNPYALAGGLATVAACALHGALFLSLKTKEALRERSHQAAARLWLPAVILVLGYLVYGFFGTDMVERKGVAVILVAAGAAIALLASGWLIRQRRHGWAFVLTASTIALTMGTLALGLYPRVMVSSLNPEWSLTITNASSSPYTLRVMTIVALIFVPVVLVYQGWSYWVFRKRIGAEDTLEY